MPQKDILNTTKIETEMVKMASLEVFPGFCVKSQAKGMATSMLSLAGTVGGAVVSPRA